MIPRWLHHVYADALGYFWLPCPICDRMFGGHEIGMVWVQDGNGDEMICCKRHYWAGPNMIETR